MSLLEKKQIKYAMGAAGLGAFLFGVFKFYRYLMTSNTPPSILTSNYDELDQQQKSALSFISKSNEYIPYDILIQDPNRDKLIPNKITYLPYLKDISYKLILNLMKGNSYQGIITISFHLDILPNPNLPLNYNGGGIKLLIINNKKLQSNQVQYLNHSINIPSGYLFEKGKNTIQIIFQNLYSFINNGLSTYFPVDDHQKYSLRQQVIYSVNGYGGWMDVERVMPCFNVINQCVVGLEVIHPDTFEVFGNTAKSLQRLCALRDYPRYPFLFDLASSSLNKSFKLNDSTISSYSTLQQSLNDPSSLSLSPSPYSSSHYINRKKANTHFYKQKLPSIHHLFFLCSSMVQLQPRSPSSLDNQFLIRYFCKPDQSHCLGRTLNKLHAYLIDLFRRLAADGIKDHVNKIDVIIIKDRDLEGYFAPGVILLSQHALTAPTLSIRTLYLLARALLGLLRLEQGHNPITLTSILDLNQAIFIKFQQFRNYLYLRSLQYPHLITLLTNQKIIEHQGYFLKYFNKELRFILRQDPQEKASFELKNLMLSFQPQTKQQFWQNFLTNYNFLSPLIIDPLLKQSLHILGPPTTQKIKQILRTSFPQSSHILSFYSDQQISSDLGRLMNQQTPGLQQRLPQIKVKQKFKDAITERYQKYLPIRSNMTQAQGMYLQFRKFNQNKNFHHLEVLIEEVKRVALFGRGFIREDRVRIDCSIAAWKLLSRLKLYPEDEELYKLIKLFENLS